MTPLAKNRPSLPLIAALVTFGVHLVANPHYGFFRDELYLIICGRHPQWGYVDQPPVTALLAAWSQAFGHSLLLLRSVPAWFAGAGVYVTCLLAEEMGGGIFAQVLGALTVFFAPVLMSFGMKISPDMPGLWLWPLTVLYILRLTKGADPRLWLAVGALMGASIQSKYTAVFFAAALVLGLLLTSQRTVLFSPWFLAGCGATVLIALPNFLWQAHYDFPMLQMLRNAHAGKNALVSPVQYFVQQLLITNLFIAPIWIAGLGWCLWKQQLRFLGYAYILLILCMIVLHGKHYYPADVYPCLMAAGGVALEIWTARARALRPVIAVAVVILGLVFVPFALPILPEAEMASYMNGLFETLRAPRKIVATEHARSGELSQDWADMHGWPQLAATVATVYNALPPGDRAQAMIVTQNYGEAAAIDFFGSQYATLPPASSGHNQYFLWGTHGATGNVVIDVAGDCGARKHLFASSEQAATFSAAWIMPYENGIPIMICRGLQKPLPEVWQETKSYR